MMDMRNCSPLGRQAGRPGGNEGVKTTPPAGLQVHGEGRMSTAKVAFTSSLGPMVLGTSPRGHESGHRSGTNQMAKTDRRKTKQDERIGEATHSALRRPANEAGPTQ